MAKLRSALWAFVAMLLVHASLCSAQGVQTGTIRGGVRDQQDLPVPGVTVTVTSPALQGPRTAVTDTGGNFTVAALPAGQYQVAFELSGFAPLSRQTTVPLGLTVELNAVLRPGQVAEAVQVVAELPGPIATPVVGANFRHEEIENLATARTLEGIAQLAPAVTENTTNTNQIVIHGGFAFDNIFMINGVDVNDNLFATPNNLFIEDAIEETQVLTSGISAEYGRFTGGVINAITKSGGNRFSGTGRINFFNPAWTTETPFEESRGTKHVDAVNRKYETTFGGPIERDRLWFFLAGRYVKAQNQVTLMQTGIGLTSVDQNKRGEIKLTGKLRTNDTIQGGFFNDPRKRTNNSGFQSAVIDPRSEVDRENPNSYYYTNYHGVLGQNWLTEAQFSQRHLGFNKDGGTSTDIIDSPFFALNCACVYNAPYFDANDPQERNNRQLTGNVTGFWNGAGRHQSKGGYEFFRSQIKGGNSQSATGYVINADFLTTAGGPPARDSGGKLIPVFVPGESYLENYIATRGATLNIDNHSFFVQDHWTINARWSADIGTRFEHVRSEATGGIVGVNNYRIVPRLAAAFDVSGNGNHLVHVTYGQYSGRYNEVQIRANSPVANPIAITTVYQGPPGQGVNFAPGFNTANYPLTPANATVSDATQNVSLDSKMTSPLTHEFTTSYGLTLARGRGYGEVAYVYRKTGNIIEDFYTLSNGFTNVAVNGISAGRFTNRAYRDTDIAHREYHAMIFQSRYRVTDNWMINGHYTLQLKNDGNYEGEQTNQPAYVSIIGDYPEAFSAARNYPEGRLQDFQRSRLRTWTVYTFNMRQAGNLSLSGLWRVDSGRVYSLVARNQAITAQQRAILAAAGYPDVPSANGNHVFFAERGSEMFKGYGVLDTSINYDIPVFRTLRPWLKFDIYNLFNNRKLIAWNTTINQNRTGPLDNLGLATTYTKTATFGTATGNTLTNLGSTTINAYPLSYGGPDGDRATPGGRTFTIALGFRF
jgi:hypothetical protein